MLLEREMSFTIFPNVKGVLKKKGAVFRNIN